MEADSIESANSILAARGYIPISVTETGGGPTGFTLEAIIERLTPIKTPELILFTKQLKTMMRAGVLSSEMESSTLFVMASSLGESVLSLADEKGHPDRILKAGTILGIIGGKDAWGTEEQLAEIERQTWRWGLEGIKDLYRIDHE